MLANTGAGKSTLLNAFLGEAELLPTNAMRACTAAIIEIEYNAQQRPGAEYTAHIEFLSHAEWEAEVKEAFALVCERAEVAGVAAGAAPPEDTPAHEAWDKLRQKFSKVLSTVTLCSDYSRALTFKIFFFGVSAAYGKGMVWTSADALLAPPSPDLLVLAMAPYSAARRRIHEHLAQSISFETQSASELCRLYSKCVDRQTFSKTKKSEHQYIYHQKPLHILTFENVRTDSVNDGSEGSLWPIVKRVLLRGPWDVLAQSVRLVDAPGVCTRTHTHTHTYTHTHTHTTGLADDNSARDAVVKKILEEANSVWLVSNVRRAVNDKTVKDMMPPAFKQALVEKGVLGSLVFIATQTDVIVRSEVAENLNLAPDVSVLECAHGRNDYFRSKLAADFKRGINRSLLPL